MVYIPETTFEMGMEIDDSIALCERYVDGCENREDLISEFLLATPVQTVELSAYWIDQTEVSNLMYAQCVAAGSCNPPLMNQSMNTLEYYGNNEHNVYPVITVNWDQAQAYCEWIGGRLPTEAEWELAARGSDGRIYPWGNEDITCELANYGGCEWDPDSIGSRLAGASPYGVINMLGNVEEWVSDWFDENYYSTLGLDNPQGSVNGESHVIRGGAYPYFRQDLSVSTRRRYISDTPTIATGFRCVTTRTFGMRLNENVME